MREKEREGGREREREREGAVREGEWTHIRIAYWGSSIAKVCP